MAVCAGASEFYVTPLLMGPVCPLSQLKSQSAPDNFLPELYWCGKIINSVIDVVLNVAVSCSTRLSGRRTNITAPGTFCISRLVRLYRLLYTPWAKSMGGGDFRLHSSESTPEPMSECVEFNAPPDTI